MRRGVALGLAILLAGCTLAPPPPAPVATPHRPSAIAREECVDLSLEPERDVFTPGDPLAIVATITNCGTIPARLGAEWCEPPVSLVTLRGEHVWRFAPSDVAAAAKLEAPACPHDEPPLLTFLAPGAQHNETFLWNGTFEADPCEPGPRGLGPSCPQWAAADGEIRLTARARAGGRVPVATATTFAFGAAPPPPPAQCGLALDAPAEIVQGRDARFVLRFDRCGEEDVTIGDPCSRRNGFGLTLQGPGVVVDPGIVDEPPLHPDGGCRFAFSPPLLVFAQGHAEGWFEWNGTVGTFPECDDEGRCSARYEQAPTGEYAVNASVSLRSTREVITANSTLRVVAATNGSGG